MKVLLIAHNASIQGSGIAFASISKQLAALGIDVVTIVPRKYGVYNLIGETHNVKKYVIRQIFNEVYPSTNGWLNKMLYIPELLRRIIAKYIFKMKLRKIIDIPDSENIVAFIVCGNAPKEDFRLVSSPRITTDSLYTIHR